MEFNKTTNLLRSLLLMLGITTLIASCEKDQSAIQPDVRQDFSYFLDNEIQSVDAFPEYMELSDREINTIIERAEKEMEANDREEGEVDTRFGWFNRDIALFKAAILVTGLAPKVVGKRVTAFAPDNSVFRSIGINRVRDLVKMDREVLRNILKYHLVPGRIFAADITPGFVHTLNGAAVELSLEGGVSVTDANGNTSMVTRADIFDFLFFNGVVHKIDGLLTPPTQNIVEIAMAAKPEFENLVAAVIRANLTETLAEGGPFTVFAPTDEAFENLLTDLGGIALEDIDVATLEAVLLYHVVEGRVFSSDLVSGTVNTLGGPIEIDASALTITDAETVVSDPRGPANIIGTDIQGTNGVIHIIDKVLLP